MEYSIKEVFESRHGTHGALLEVDLSQLEVCALAEITRDPLLTYELNNGLDVHRANAATWKGKKEVDVTDAERKAAKVMTFQTLYGAGPRKMAETLGITEDEVKDFLQRFLDKYKNIEKHFAKINAYCNSTMVGMEPLDKWCTIPIDTPTGRSYTADYEPLKYKPGYYGVSPTKLKNYPIQGFATGDLIPLVINNMLAYLHVLNQEDPGLVDRICFVNTIHDSAMFDVTLDSLGELLQIIELTFIELPAIFKELFDFELQLEYTYEVKYGPNWKDMQKLSRTEIIDLLTNGE